MGCCCCRSWKMATLAAGVAVLISAGAAAAQHEMPMGAPASTANPAGAGTPDLPKYVADPIPIFTVGLGAAMVLYAPTLIAVHEATEALVRMLP